MMRIFGPNMSPISFGYGIAFSVLFLFAVGYRWLALIAIPLLICCSVKRALILVIFVALAWTATWLFGATITLVRRAGRTRAVTRLRRSISACRSVTFT